MDWYEGARAAPVLGQDPFDGAFLPDCPDAAINSQGREVEISPTPVDPHLGTPAGFDMGFCNTTTASAPGFHMRLRNRNPGPAVLLYVVGGRGRSDPAASVPLWTSRGPQVTSPRVRPLGDGGGIGDYPNRGPQVNSRWHPEPTADLHDVPPYMATPHVTDSRASEQRGVTEDTAEASEIFSPTNTVAPGWGGATVVGVCVTPVGAGQSGG